MQKLLGDVGWATYSGRLHAGIDTLARPPILSLVDDMDFRVRERRRLPERPAELIAQLLEAGPAIADVVVLARHRGYGLVDRLVEAGLRTYLITPSELRDYKTLKNVSERHDAFWVAHLLRAGALPDGDVYARRDIRDAHHYPSHLQDRRPPLPARLRVDRSRAPDLGGNVRLPDRRGS